MSFIEWLWRLVSNFGLIIRRGHSFGRTIVLSTYLRIELKHYFLAHLLKKKMTKEKVFGFEIHFFNYETFAVLFEEVIIPDVYYFESKSPQPVILDCGSNIGLAIFYFKRLYPNSKIIAFEADDGTFSMLERNVRVNNLKDVTVVNKALYDSKGSITFYVAPHAPGSLVASTRKESLATSEAKEVPTDVLAEYVTGRVDFVKMDIEGAEDRVMKNLFEANKMPLIGEMVIEYHHHMTAGEDRLGSFLEIFEQSSFGYAIKAPLVPPFRKGEFQCFLLYAYNAA